jgi:hypothetical protein
MAIVAGPIKLSLSYQDDDLAIARTSVDFPQGTALADVQAYATAYAALIAPVTDCALIGYSVNQEYYDNTYPVAAAGSDVEDKGVLVIRTVGNHLKSISWPGVLESVLVNSISPPGTFIDLANVAVAAVVSALITGLGTPAVAPSNNRGDDLRSVKEAYKKNTSSQKSREYKG